MEEAPDLPGFDLGIETNEKPDTPEGRLDHWKRKLLDLTKRNRLLNLKPSKTAIPLICPDPAALEDKLAEGKKIRSEEHTSELQSLMRISYAVFCSKKKKNNKTNKLSHT